MTTAIAHHNGSAISADTMESIIVGGNLANLTPAQRVEYYGAKCRAAGLDPMTQPFEYITLQGKLTLYAKKAATDQLIANRSLTVEIASRGVAGDLYEVVCRVVRRDGTHVDDMAAVSIKGLSGEAYANAVMKCVTKAKRRTVLSACGLGVLDEGETETIPMAVTGGVDVVTGEVVEPVRQIEAPKSADTDAKKAEWDKANRVFWKEVTEAATGQGIDKDHIEAVVYHVLKAAYGFDGLHDLTAPKLKAFGKRLSEPGIFAAKWAEWQEANGGENIPDFDDVTAAEIDGDNMAAAND